jgi:hypothetical protein
MNNGFIALTIVLAVSTTLLCLMASSVTNSGIFFDMTLRKEYREMNYYFAYDCIDQAILMLAHDYFFITQTEISIPFFNCSILSVNAIGDKRVIKTRGDYRKAYVYRSAEVKMKIHDLEVVKIE